ncbi:hypothetical protein ACFFX1_10745 [Dactylosporangium sucinum]|uniref:hypothetical protein n=1 Tax=Dactylosporangium sucinum TaxID=1424081 RepID=UPI00167CAF9A|nr:hypothetical protein [Dactylosporangium sucinum]
MRRTGWQQRWWRPCVVLAAAAAGLAAAHSTAWAVGLATAAAIFSALPRPPAARRRPARRAPRRGAGRDGTVSSRPGASAGSAPARR